MPRDFLTDEEVEAEIERLSKSDAVKLARKEQYLKNRRRQQLYTLRVYEKRGKQLQAQGVTVEALEIMYADIEGAEAYE